MRTLSVVGAEDGGLVVVSESGERFRIEIDDALRGLVRTDPVAETRRLTPREIQAQVRAGLSAQQVAALAGASLGYVERFAGPVLAERRWVVDSALATRLPPDEVGGRRTFGALMGERLAALAADGVRWTSAKEASGWVVGVAFTADGVDHDARWRFDPKRQQLEPENVEAATLSQTGVPAALTPRLRAIEPTGPVRLAPAPSPEPGPSRFDSQAFVLPDVDAATADAAGSAAPTRRSPAAAAAKAAQPKAVATPATAKAAEPAAAADLPPTQAMPVVKAAHRAVVPAPAETGDAPATAPTVPAAFARPPARDTAPAATPVTPIRPAQAPVTRLPDRPARTADADDDDAPRSPVRPATGRRGRPRDGRRPLRQEDGATTRPVSLPGRGRGGRTSMPSWDEIVFGRDED